MVNKTRQRAIESFRELESRIASLKKELSRVGTPKDGEKIDIFSELKNQIKQATTEKLCLRNKIDTSFPISIEGFLGQDEFEVEQNERGIVTQTCYYLGCPTLSNNRFNGIINYDRFRDVTEILQQNTSKFLRVTIEEIPIGQSEYCAKCDNRFCCLTTKVQS